MAETLTIRIKPLGESMATFRQTFKALEGSTRSKARVQRREEVFFTSIEAARKLLTPNRLSLLRAIRTERPGSMYALARRVGRDLNAGGVQASLPKGFDEGHHPAVLLPQDVNAITVKSPQCSTMASSTSRSRSALLGGQRAPHFFGRGSGSPHGAPSKVGKASSPSSTVGSAPSFVGVGGVSSLA